MAYSVRQREPFHPAVLLMRNVFVSAACAALFLSVSGIVTSGQQPDRSLAMHWRQIGPTRAGRARALAGVPSQPNVFYIGFDNGGVWRSTDYGSTWEPLFDDQPTGSIGAIAVAPSDPNIIYVGTGAGHHPPRSRDRRRRLQVDRRRQDVDAPRPPRHADDRDDRRRSARSRTGSSSRRSATRTDRTRSAASSDRPTAAGRSRRSSTRTSTRAATTSASTRPIRTSSTPRSGSSSRASSRGRASAAPGERHLQVDRRRHDVEAADRRTAERDPGEHRDRAEQSADAVRDGRPAALPDGRAAGAAAPATDGRRRLLQVHRRRRALDARRERTRRGAGDVTGRSASARAHRRRRPADARGRSEERERRLQLRRRCSGARRTAASPGRRCAARPAATTTRRSWINPNNPNIILVVSDQGGVVSANRGAVVEQLVHAADGRDVSRLDRQRVPLSRLRRPAGFRLGVRRQPVDGRRDHVPRLASGEHPGVRRGGAGSEGSRHRLRQRAHERLALQPARLARRRTSGRAPSSAAAGFGRNVRTMPIAWSPVDPNMLVLRVERGVEDRPIARTAGRASAPISRVRRGRFRRTPASTRARSRRRRSAASPRSPVAARHQRDLGRHRRRQHPGDDGRRREVDERHAAADQAVDAHLQHRGGSLRQSHRVRRGEHDAHRRLESALLAHARRRQDVDGDQHGHRAGRGGELDPRRSAAEGTALRRDRHAGLGVVRRRRSLAVAASSTCRRSRCATSK